MRKGGGGAAPDAKDRRFGARVVFSRRTLDLYEFVRGRRAAGRHYHLPVYMLNASSQLCYARKGIHGMAWLYFAANKGKLNKLLHFFFFLCH